MSTKNQPGRSRTFRPGAEDLEGRRLLSAVVSGTNTAGDRWTLRLDGPGTIQVVKQDDASGSPAALDSATEIKSITISGTDPIRSKLNGTVRRSGAGDGRVFFQQLTEQSNRSERTGGGLGVLSVNMPAFYLGVTDPTTATSATQPRALISIPDGVNSLRFGGVDTTAFFGTDPTQAATADGQNDLFLIRLGLPFQNGTSIIVNQITSSDQAAVASTVAGQTNSPTQDSVVFQVGGRLSLFEANRIIGSADANRVDADTFSGGTIVSSLTDATTGITGEIGFVRVGGNATNFSVVTNNLLANLYIGGETDNVAVLAPNGARNLYFGKGLDSTTIRTHAIESLYANRDATNSRVVADRKIGDLRIGGDVANTTVLAGYTQNLTSPLSTIENNLSSGTLTAATYDTPQAQVNGQITTFLSGNVTNSVFAASTQPYSQVIDSTDMTFGNTQDAFLPLGTITARVEGAISNATATPDMPNKAFYARNTKVYKGPVSPPNVVEPPLPLPARPISLPGIPRVFPAANGNKQVSTITTTSTGLGISTIRVGGTGGPLQQ